tara:strand:- start:104729 stop:105475 length:747 start_codon:yes stop_codon:yes gene_type:complete
MCTAIILRRPNHRWPLILAANRDEMRDRDWEAPGRHWNSCRQIIGGRDKVAGGSWIGINDYGLVAVILNRSGSLGPSKNQSSRGNVVVNALKYSTPSQAISTLLEKGLDQYSGFNLLIADTSECLWLRHDTKSHPQVKNVQNGLSMITNRDLNDQTCPKISYYKNKFTSAKSPNIESGDLSDWEKILSDDEGNSSSRAKNTAICLNTPDYGTVNSSIIGMRIYNSRPQSVFFFCDGAPGSVKFRPVNH